MNEKIKEFVKIVMVDNFDRESFDDELIATDVPIFYAETITKALNDKFGGEYSPNFFCIKSLDYKLFVYQP